MTHLKNRNSPTTVDTKEFEIPQTLFIRDIENKVFQTIVLQCLANIKDIGLVEGSFIDHLLGRKGAERGSGIYTEQDEKKHSVKVKVEVNIKYGASIPEKSEEIQNKIIEQISDLTGLHVSSVHVVFKGLLPETSQAEEKPAELLIESDYKKDDA